MSLSIREDTEVGTLLYKAQAVDKDRGINGLVSYFISDASTFAIDSQTGEIRLQQTVDFESVKTYTLKITASDSGNPVRTSSLNLTIVVTDVNDNGPMFTASTYTFVAQDLTPTQTLIGACSANDLDSGNNGNISYALNNGYYADMFTVDPTNCKIFNKAVLKSSDQSQYRLTIVAYDGGVPTKQSICGVQITVNNGLVGNPLAFQSSYTFSIEENQPPLSTVGFIPMPYVMSPNYISFALPIPSQYFRVVPNSGEILSLVILDRELIQTHQFDVVATDRATPQRTATMHITIRVLDVNDNSPKFVGNNFDIVYLQENQILGSKVAQVLAIDPDFGTNGTVSYSFPQGINFKSILTIK